MQSIKKIVLFGCGNGGINAFKFLKKKYKIVAFTDNNKDLYGSTLFNLIIIDPMQLKVLDFDYIFISSMYGKEINEQLISELNIPNDKIKFLDIEIISGQKMNISQITIYNAIFLLSLMMLVYGITQTVEYLLN